MESIIYNQAGKEIGKITLPESIFGVKWSPDMIHQAVTSMMMDRRHTVAHAKTRGEVSGGGKKPWQQKGTGRARHGSTRSPLWVGGGTTHGPRNDKNFARKVNSKMAMKALTSILSKKAKDGEIIFFDSISVGEGKTKNAAEILNTMAGIKGYEPLADKKKNALFVAMPKDDKMAKRGFKNISNVKVIETRNLNAADILTKKYIAVVNPEESFKILENRIK